MQTISVQERALSPSLFLLPFKLDSQLRGHASPINLIFFRPYTSLQRDATQYYAHS